MSNREILGRLSKLTPHERREVFQRLCELEEQDLLRGAGPTEQERKLLDEALAAYERDGDAGTPWRQVLRKVRTASKP